MSASDSFVGEGLVPSPYEKLRANYEALAASYEDLVAEHNRLWVDYTAVAQKPPLWARR